MRKKEEKEEEKSRRLFSSSFSVLYTHGSVMPNACEGTLAAWFEIPHAGFGMTRLAEKCILKIKLLRFQKTEEFELMLQ